MSTVSPWQTFGILGAVLAQAGMIPGFSSEGFSGAHIRWDGSVDLCLDHYELAEALASRLGLSETRRWAHRAKPLFTGHDTRHINHQVWWKGDFSGHDVEVRVGWSAPLGDLDLAEGEELPPGTIPGQPIQGTPIDGDVE